MYSSIIDKLQEGVGGDENSYRSPTKVDLTISQPDQDNWFDYDIISNEIPLTFDFEYELRSWGIKGIEFNLKTEKIDIEYEIHTGEEGDDREEKSISISKDDIRIEWIPGHAYTVGDLEIWLEQDGSLSEATLEVFYIQK